MKLLTTGSLVSFVLYSTTQATEAPVGHVYLFDRDSTARPPQAQAVDPETAGLIFAQRLGLSQFESIGNVEEKVLEQLNWFGGRWQTPFHIQSEALEPARRVVVFVEGLKNSDQIIDCKSATHCPYVDFTISSPPTITENEELLSHFRTVSKTLHPPGSYSSGHARFHEILKPLQKKNHDDLVTSVHNNVFVHVDVDKVVTTSYDDTINFLRDAISDIYKLAEHEDMSLAVALFPPSKKNTKRSTNSYGKREVRQSEEPLRASAPQSGNSATAKVDQEAPAAPLASNTTIKGIVPSCFGTLNACQGSTRNCTGHGLCYLKYKDTDHGKRECWTCGCKATVTTNKDGSKKTTNWGGGACQKKDVTVPFWILAGFSILLVATISWAIGLLYSMGDEELPSVIGAGVSGPRPK